MIKGVDVSRWQGLIDWKRLAGQVQFAVIKIGGSDDGFYPDGQAVRNAIEARANGVQAIGFYVYLGGAFNTADEVNHIKNLISNIGGLRPGEFLALDWEEHTGDEVGYVYGIAKGLIDAGIAPPMIYMSLSRVTGNNWQRLVDLNCALWVAAWGNNNDVPESNEVPGSDEWPFWAIWQYSSTGNVPGVAGRVDLDQFNGEVSQLLKYGQRGQVTLPAPVNGSRVVLSSEANGEYTVVSGDSLSAIAAKYGKSWQDLWAINRDRVSQPNKIFPGQKLRVWGDLNPPVPTSTPAANPNVREYTVQNGDSLSVIAAKYSLPSWVLLYEANKNIIGADPNLIRPGQVLRIP